MEIIFRPMREADFALAERFKRATVIAAMGEDTLFETWFPPERSYRMFLESMLAFDPESCGILHVDGTVAGSVEMRLFSNGQGHLTNIYLEPEWRGRGLGEVLDGYAMAFFRKHGADYATLRTNPKQPKVVAFYERLGWRPKEIVKFGMMEMGKDVL